MAREEYRKDWSSQEELIVRKELELGLKVMGPGMRKLGKYLEKLKTSCSKKERVPSRA
jgi:hypothetical protein